MVTVEVDAAAVESRLAGGQVFCPVCGGVLVPWGWARVRVVRDVGRVVVLRPRRGLCTGCGVSHVLLPVFALVRRADAVEVIGAALAAKVSGSGFRKIAAGLLRPAETVRGWLRRFAAKAEAVRVFFTALLVAVGIDPVPPSAAVSVFADAVSAVVGARQAVASRWPLLGEVSPWTVAVAASGGLLLAPSWPPVSINTSCP